MLVNNMTCVRGIRDEDRVACYTHMNEHVLTQRLQEIGLLRLVWQSNGQC